MRSHLQLLLGVAGLCAVAHAQTPTITGLTPPSVAAGSSQFKLVVNGTNFVSSCYVTWNGTVTNAKTGDVITTAFVNSTELDAVIPASFVIQSGETAYVGVKCPGPPSVQASPLQFQVTGGSSTLTITTPPTLTQATAGNFYMVALQASGGTQPYTWSLAQGSALPTGLTLSPGGVLQGRPQIGQYAFNIQVTDSSSTQLSVQQTFMLAVAAAGSFTITTTSPLPGATVGTLYSVNLAASGGTQPYLWSLVSGSALPNGLTLSTGGALTGTPTAAGQSTFTIQVTDSTSPTALMAQQTLSLTVGSTGSGGGTCGSGGTLTITTTSLPGGTVGQAYNTTLTASGGTGSCTWSGTSLPSWLTLTAATGVLSGTPPTAGSYSISVQVADGASHTATKSFSLVASSGSSPSLSITTGSTLVQGTVGAPYYQTLAASGGTQPYIWSALTALPPGLSLSTDAAGINGILSGTPTTASSYAFTIQVSDSSSPALTAKQTFSLTISAPGGTLTVSVSSLPAASAGQAYATTITAYGGKPPYTWAVAPSTPSWLTIDPNAGTLSGTPPTTGTYSVTVQVSDSTTANTASKTFSLSVTMSSASLSITTPTTLPVGVVGVAYSPVTFAATGGMGPYTFVVFSGNTDGLAFGADNVTFSGTPQAAGTFTFTVQAADNTVLQATANFTLTVTAQAAAPLTISTSSLPGATAGQAYTATLTATGGTAPYSWTGTLPSWLTLTSSTGALSGTPPASGSFTISVQVTDSTTPTARTASRTFTLVVAAAALSITSSPTLPGGMVGATYTSTTLAATGGTPPYTWVITAGNTDGLSMDATGVVSGTPQAAGTFTFTVQVSDSSATALQGTKTFSLTVSAPTLTITPVGSSSGTVGVAFSQSYTVVGGTAPYTWKITSGTVPGLTLNGSASPATLSGTPTQQGSFTITVQATDANSTVGTRTLTLTIAALPAVTISGLPATANPLAQYTLTVSLASAYPVNISGMAILSSSPSDSGPSDGSIQFSAGGRSASFTINAGQTSTTLAIQTGSVAGTVTLTLSQLSAGGTDVTPTPAPSAKTQMAGAAPVITAATASRSGSTLTIQITGYATSRDMTQAVFTFTAASGQTLQSGASSITVPLTSLFSTYFQNSQYASFGSQFVFSQPFTIQGDINSVIPQNVTLTNRVGSSTPSAVQ